MERKRDSHHRYGKSLACYGVASMAVIACLAVATFNWPVQADPPGVGDEVGRKVFSFNLIGHPGEYTGHCGSGHRIFVDRTRDHGHIIVRHTDDGWHIEDCDATGHHKGEIHAQDTGRFAMYVRILGKPGGSLDICTDLLEDHTGTCVGGHDDGAECITDSDCTGGGFCELPEEAHMCLVGEIHLKREGGKSRFTLATGELFDDDLEDVMWNVTTDGFRIAQFRVYELVDD